MVFSCRLNLKNIKNKKIQWIGKKTNLKSSPFLPFFWPPGRTLPEKPDTKVTNQPTAGRSSSLPRPRPQSELRGPETQEEEHHRGNLSREVGPPTVLGPMSRDGLEGRKWMDGSNGDRINGLVISSSYKWWIHCGYNCYNPLTNVLQTSWDIQVDGRWKLAFSLCVCVVEIALGFFIVWDTFLHIEQNLCVYSYMEREKRTFSYLKP